MRFIPVPRNHFAILARSRDAWRALALERFDVDRLILSCVPQGASCDPSVVADALREWFEAFEEGTAAPGLFAEE